VDAAAFQGLVARLAETLRAFHAESPYRFGLPKEELKARGAGAGVPGDVAEAALGAMREAGEVLLLREKVRLAAAGDALGGAARDAAARIESIFQRERFAPPLLSVVEEEARLPRGAAHDLMETLVDLGVLVKVTPELAYHRDLLAEAAREIRSVLTERGELGVADLKERLGVSRKYAVPLLEHFDRLGVTRRKGDLRVPGPRIDGAADPGAE
jgi:selenocysteine-specific elongation factor